MPKRFSLQKTCAITPVWWLKKARLHALSDDMFIIMQMFHKMSNKHAKGLKEFKTDIWSIPVCPKDQPKGKKQITERKDNALQAITKN